MKSLARIVVGTALIALPSLAPAATVTTVFNNGAAGTGNVDSWSADGNWTNTSPLTITTAGNSVIVQIGAQPANNLIGIDTGQMSNTVLSLTFNAPSSTGTITGDVNIRPQGIETLTVAGAITNLTAHNMSFSLPVLSGANATYAGGPTGGSLSFNTSFDVQSTTVTMINNVNIPGNLVGTSAGTLVTGDGATASKVILSGSNNTFFSGSLVINALGNLQLGTGGTTGDTGSSTTAIVDNGTLTIDRSDALVGSLVISGTGNLAQIGSGKYTLTTANTFSGTTSVTSGTLVLSNQSALQNSTLATGGTGIVFDTSVGTHAFTLGGLSGSTNLALTDNGAHAVALTVGKNGGSTNYSGALTGAGSLLKLGTGNLALAGANTYTGGTTISAGQLTVNGSTAAGTVAVGTAGTLAGAGTIGTASDTDTVTGNGTINLTTPGKIAGTLNVTGGNWNGTGSVGVATNVNSGLLTIGSGANLTTPTLNVNSGSVVAADTSSTITGSVNYGSGTSSTYQGVIAGAGKTVTLNNSAATWTLSGANTYTGATSVNAGTLIVTGTTTSATTVGNNTALATLSGTGRINGAVILSSTVSHAAHLAPGANALVSTVGTLHVGSLTIGTGSMLDFDLSSTAAGANDAIAMTGTLAFGGLSTVNFNEVNGTLQTGVAYTLISGGTASTGSATFSATGLTDLTAAFTSAANGLQVVFSPTGGNTSYYYTGTGASAGVFGEADNYNALPSGGAAQTIAPGSTSNIFIGATSPVPSSVAISLGNSSITINSLTFTTTGSGAVLSSTGGVLTVQSGITVQTGVSGSEAITAPVALGTTQTWTVNAGSTLLDSGGISGGFSLTKAGTGAFVILGGTNYTGATTINAGVINLQSSGAINGTSGVTVANGAALQLQNDITTAAKSLSLIGTGIGNGALENVSDDNTYAGLVTLTGATTIGADAGSITLSNAGTITGSFGLTLAGAGSGTVASIIGTGTSTLTKTGAGMWTLAGANTFTGLTTISNGTLALAAGGSLAQSSGVNLSTSSAAFDISSGNHTIKDLTGVNNSNVNLGASALTLGTANSTTFDGDIAGTGGSIVKNGSGTLTLTGTNTYDGGTTINSGAASVQSVAGNLGSGGVTLGGGKLLTTTSSTAANAVTLNSGTSTLAAASGTTGAYTGAIGGPGSLVIGDGTNAGTVILAANNNYAGTTTITAGTTAGIGAGGAAGTAGTGAIVDNGTAVFNRTDSATIGNTITGTGRLVQAGTGTIALTATNNTYSGGTSVIRGVLSVGAVDATLGTGGITLGGGELVTTGATSSTSKTITLNAGTNTLAANTTAIYNGVISGANALMIGDATNGGTVAFTAANTYTGATTIANGTLQLGSGSASGSVAGNIVNNSALIFDHSGTFTYGGVISGSGNVNSVQGTLNLTGVNTYNGATSITAGSLLLSGSGSIANSAITIAGGTTLTSIGSVNGVGALTLSGGTVNLKNSAINTLNTASLAGTGILSIDIGGASNTSDLINISGASSLGANSIVVNINSFGSASLGTTYTFLTDTSGVLSAGDFSLGSLTGTLLSPDDVTFGISGDGKSAFFQVTGPAGNAYYYTGTGTNTTAFGEADNYNTLASGGAVQTAAPGSASNIFIGTTSPTPANLTPTLGNSNLTINTLNFTTTGAGATLSSTGGVLTIKAGVTEQTGVVTISAPVALGNSQTWTINSGGTLIDSGGISGAFGLTKSGTGALVLMGVDTYSGATAVNAGALNLQNSGALNGTSGVAVASGAALQLQGGITTAAAPLSLAGVGGGNGALENVSGANTYAGQITLAAATTIGSDAGILNLSNAGAITGAGFGLTLTGAGSGTVAGAIGTGTGTLVKSGAGTWTLNGVDTFTGATTISAGTLALGTTGSLAQSSGVNLSTGSATLDVTSGNHTVKDLSGVANSNVNLGASALTLGTANSTTFAGVIAGSGGSIVKNGTGTITLSGTNTYDGGTTINGGAASVQSVTTNLGSGGVTLGGGKLLTSTSSTSANAVTLNSGTNTLAATSGTNATYAGTIGGSGSVVLGDVTHSGTVILAANNNYAGTTTITAGTTAGIGAGGVAGSVGTGAITNNGIAVFNRTDSATVVNTITGTGRVVQAGSGTTTLSATNTYSGGTTVSGGELSVGAVDTGLGTGSITLSGGELATTGATSSTTKMVTLGAGINTVAASNTAIYGGVISGGSNALTIGDGTNAGTVAFTGNNTYTGVTTIANGTLQLGSGSTGGSVAGNIVNNSALIFDHSGMFTYGGVISGSGTVLNVQGTLVLNNTNTYSGATTIGAGTLELIGFGSIANSAVTVGNGTTLAALGVVPNVGALTLSGGTVNLQNGVTNILNTPSLSGTGIISIDIGTVTNTSDLINVNGATSIGANSIVVNVNSLSGTVLGTTYTFLTDTSGTLDAGDFTLGSFTGTLPSSDDVTFGISTDGKSAFLKITGAQGTSYYYTGRGTNPTDFTAADNYSTATENGNVQTIAPGATSNIYIGTTGPVPSNQTPLLGTSNLTINTLNFTISAQAVVLSSAGGVLTIKSGLTEVFGVNTISAPVALGGSQAWMISPGSTLVDSGGISGAFGLTKSGTGALVFTGANTYTGATTISAGALNLQNSGALNGTSGVTVASGAALQLQGGITTAAAPLSLAGAGGGNGALENVSGNNTYAGLVTLTAATTIGSDAGTMTLSNAGTITGSGSALTLAGAGNGVISSAIGTGAGTLTKSGSGTWTLNGANSFTGATTVGAGTLALGTTGSLAQSSAVNLSTGSATLDVSSGNHTIKDLTGVAGSGVNLGGSALALGTANSTTFSGVISGAGGSVVKNGAGILGLSGTNTYSGGTTINAGTVKVASIDTNLGSGDLTFGGGELLTTGNTTTAKSATFSAGTSTIATANGTTATYNGAFGGAGALKLGDASNGGILVLNGANSFTGATIVSGTVIAGNAAALGTGNVTMSAGTLGLGNGANEIDVAGNYRQTGGTLVLSLSGTAAGATPGYQFLNVTGTAALGGKLVVNVSNLYVPLSTDTFTFVQAQGGITGGFSSAISNLAALSITAQGGGFIISQSGFTTLPVSYTSNGLSIARSIDAGMLSMNPTPAFQSLVTNLDSLSAPATLYLLPDAFNQLSPDKFENFARTDVVNNVAFMIGGYDAYFNTQRSVNGDFIGSNGQIDSSNLTVMNPDMDPNLAGVGSRLLAWNPSPIGHGLLSDVPNPVLGGVELREEKKEMKSSAPEDNPFSSFIMGSVVLAQDFSQADVPHADTTTGAVQIGGDYRITPHLRAGVMFAFGHTDADTDNNGSKATTDSYAPGVYISYAQGGWYANMLASYGFDSFTSDRHISFANLSGVAHGAPTGDHVIANLDGGYDFHHKNWTYGPTLGVAYTHLDVDGFSEDGIDQADLTVGKQETDSLRSRLGAHVSYLIQTGKLTLTPHLDASWQHEFMDQGRGITSQFNNGAGPFSIRTPDPSRESALIDAGLSADLGQFTFFGDYAVQAGQDNYFGQSVQAGVKLGF